MAELGAQSMGSLVHLGRGDEDEKKRRLQQVLDILKVRLIVMDCLARG